LRGGVEGERIRSGKKRKTASFTKLERSEKKKKMRDGRKRKENERRKGRSAPKRNPSPPGAFSEGT